VELKLEENALKYQYLGIEEGEFGKRLHTQSQQNKMLKVKHNSTTLNISVWERP